MSSLISVHLRYMGNEHNTSLIRMDRLIRVIAMHIFFYYCYYFYLFIYFFILFFFFFFFFFGNDMPR